MEHVRSFKHQVRGPASPVGGHKQTEAQGLSDSKAIVRLDLQFTGCGVVWGSGTSGVWGVGKWDKWGVG